MSVHVAMPAAQRAALSPCESFPPSCEYNQYTAGPQVAGMAYQWFRDMYSRNGFWNSRIEWFNIFGVAIKLG